MKNSSDTIWNRTRDLLTCSAVPQPTVPSRAHTTLSDLYKSRRSWTFNNQNWPVLPAYVALRFQRFVIYVNRTSQAQGSNKVLRYYNIIQCFVFWKACEITHHETPEFPTAATKRVDILWEVTLYQCFVELYFSTPNTAAPYL